MSELSRICIKDISTRITKGTTPNNAIGGFTDNGVNFIKSESVSYDGRIDRKSFAFISKQTHEKLKRSQLEKNDILFSMAGIFLGKNALVTEDILPANTNQALAIIRVDQSKINPKYLHYFLRQKTVIDYVNNLSGQSAQPNINMEEIGGIELDLPPLQEQDIICEVLSSLDDKIDLLHRNNKTLEEVAETLFRQWFVEFKFPNKNSSFMGKEKMQYSDYGLIPKEWNYGTIGDVTKIIETGRRPKGGVGFLRNGVPSIGAENVKNIGYYNFDKTKFISEDYYEKMNSGKLENRDILVYKDGGVPGTFIPHFSMVGEGFPYSKMAINEHVFRLVSKDQYFQNYLFFWLNTELTVSELAERGTGAAIPGINSTQLKNTPCLIPDKETVIKFDRIVEPLIYKILKNSVHIKNLSILRDTLLPKLMSGQVRVKN